MQRGPAGSLRMDDEVTICAQQLYTPGRRATIGDYIRLACSRPGNSEVNDYAVVFSRYTISACILCYAFMALCRQKCLPSGFLAAASLGV
jgi:hypothetical protein